MMLPSGVLVEAEAFSDYGGWVLDSQFDLEMGSPYLLAHGNGVPVADATTEVSIPASGEYYIWVRAKDWVPGHHPGRFKLNIGGQEVETVFGANNLDWAWQNAGKVRLSKGTTSLALHDLTGFCGRCDAIFFTREEGVPPEGGNEVARAWRRMLRGLPEKPTHAGHFDVVVLGGGVVGSAAALAAARLGQRVALVHSRPYLGGNASREIGLRPRGVTGPLVDEIYERGVDGDIHAKELLDAEPSATLVLEHTVYNATTEGSKIISIDARDAVTGRERRFTAPIFIDCSGVALFGRIANAETLYGHEAKSEYGESLATEEHNDSHHGHTVFFRTAEAASPVPFPEVPWATEVAKDFADLGGQLAKLGFENAPGPAASPPDMTVKRRMRNPLTHYWEYGQYLDPYTNGERIRDHLLRAIYGTFSNVKTMAPEKFANLKFDHVAFVAAQGEFKRYKGDYVLSEPDIRTHKAFPDAVVKNGGAFCLHIPPDRDAKYDFRLKYWEWDERDEKDYDIPFRCLYSVNLDNVMMAGKHISVTHVAGSNTKFMGNGAQHGIATAVAAHLCNKYGKTPRAVGKENLEELKRITKGVAEKNEYPRKAVAQEKEKAML
ncbi:FAD dependent oxidoreductase [Paraphoma chrysanthemicola]|uniref:FAD dependent oxidoreductase n=1 Tax=Paraphoma chrysanthemicola TaxID=798071 RepID=A0A8K0R300_9PLEO|nr:FAD dependent oxidoreductase [Paraphoma chrysanthemicola]